MGHLEHTKEKQQTYIEIMFKKLENLHDTIPIAPCKRLDTHRCMRNTYCMLRVQKYPSDDKIVFFRNT